MKTCTKCGGAKAREAFSRDARAKDGLRPDCKACVAERARRYYEENAEKVRERVRRYREKNAEKVREKDRRWREENAEKWRECYRRYHKENPHVNRARAAKRRASLAQSTPPWSNADTVARLYWIASMATRVFGEPYHVDHIVPLRGKRATGLHAHTNLRVIPGTENLRKHAELDESLAVDRAALARSLAAIVLRAYALRDK